MAEYLKLVCTRFLVRRSVFTVRAWKSPTAEIAEAGRRVGEQVPDDYEDRASHCHDDAPIIRSKTQLPVKERTYRRFASCWGTDHRIAGRDKERCADGASAR